MFTDEFKESMAARAALCVIPFTYFIVFTGWFSRSMITVEIVAANNHVCPAYFQNCEWLYFLSALPDGYSQSILYMFLFGVLTFAVYLLTQKEWRLASLVLIIPYLWHGANVFLFTDYANGNYEYYLFLFTSIILFFPHKEFFAKLMLVMFYVLSTFAKVHPAWIAGTYFTNLQTGLPIFPNWSIPLWTNFIILAELIGAWFLLSSRPILQRTALAFFVAFHLYSGILVGYRYPATVLPMVLAVFGPWYRYQVPPFTKRSVIGWSLMVLLICFQMLPKLIPGDEKLTLEGNQYGLYMFDSNHQCISEAIIYYRNGEVRQNLDAAVLARDRCGPYRYWYRFNNVCDANDEVERISWKLDHSINGEPFLRIIDIPDACAVEYHPFKHNEWIKTHEDNPEVIGRPFKNLYY